MTITYLYCNTVCQISDFDLHCAWMKIEASGESYDLKVVNLGPETTPDPSCFCSLVLAPSCLFENKTNSIPSSTPAFSPQVWLF